MRWTRMVVAGVAVAIAAIMSGSLTAQASTGTALPARHG